MEHFVNFPGLDLKWFIPPADLLLPVVAATVVGDDQRQTLRGKLICWSNQWQRQVGIEARDPVQRSEYMAANGSAYLLLLLADQTTETIIDAARFIAAAPELGFRTILLAVAGTSLSPEAAHLGGDCAMTVVAEEQDQLLHPLKLLLSPTRMVGYDNADVLEIWKGRIGRVTRVDRVCPEALHPLLQPHDTAVSGTVLLMLSNAEAALAVADAIGTLVSISRAGGDFLWALNRHGEAVDYVELVTLAELPR
ncbi:MAG: hypothetical protein M3Q08_02160 [Pseudomonadota bacterium]|nr:hypothetical protein [Pseudomonadota bacterium]